MARLSATYRTGLLLLLLSAVAFGVTASLHQSDAAIFLPVLLLPWAAYAWSIQRLYSFRWQQLVAAGILLRACFFFHAPGWSDDYLRFLWDGTLTAAGYNPYLWSPAEWVEVHSDQWSSWHASLLGGMNSPNYHSVYPPVCQVVWSTVATFSSSLQDGWFHLRMVVLLSETATLLLLVRVLHHAGLPLVHAGIYALNPLVIAELTGNLHPEAFMILLLTLTIYLWQRSQPWLAAVAFAGAVMSKLLPLILVPFIVARIGWRQTLRYGMVSLATGILLLLPFADARLLDGPFSSLGLYFRTFEFNASVYYVLRTLGEWWWGYNALQVIGPVLAACAFTWILWQSWKSRDGNWFDRVLVGWIGYLLLSTTVHPWYLAVLVLFSVGTSMRTGLVWTALAGWSYVHYITGQENYVVITAEYALLATWAVWEWYQRRTPPASSARAI